MVKKKQNKTSSLYTLLILKIFSQHKAIFQDLRSHFSKKKITKTVRSKAKVNTNKFCKHKKRQWF